MEESRVKRIEKLCRKQAALLDELQQNLDAELLRVTQYSASDECAQAMSKAMLCLAESTYWLMQVLAQAGDEELKGQMQLSPEKLQAEMEDE